MRVYYNARGQRRGYSLSGTEAYVNDWLQLFWMFIVVALVAMVVLAAAALILTFVLVVGLLWCVGWTMARLDIGGDKGPRLQARMARVFQSGKQKSARVKPRGGQLAVAAPKYNVVCPKCSKAVTLPAGQNLKCPSCRRRINVTPKPPAGPRDPWLNEVAVALADSLSLVEVARNTGKVLGGAPLEADIGLEDDKFIVYVNLFATETVAHQAEIGLRALPRIRHAISNGLTILRTAGPLLYMANGRGSVVDEFRLNDVIQVVGKLTLPAARGPKPQPTTTPDNGLDRISASRQTTTRPSKVPSQAVALDLPDRFTQRWIVENVPELSPDELSHVLAELRRRGWTDADLRRRVMPYRRPSHPNVPQTIRTVIDAPPHPVSIPTPSGPTTASSPLANGVLYFSGNGSKNLGTLVVPIDSTVAWTNDGGFFSILDDDSAFGISSEGYADTSVIEAGTYRHVSVKAAGNWTMSIAPGAQ